MYSRDDIKNAIINGKLKIHPFNEKSLTGIGYNISTGCINNATILANDLIKP